MLFIHFYILRTCQDHIQVPRYISKPHINFFQVIFPWGNHEIGSLLFRVPCIIDLPNTIIKLQRSPYFEHLYISQAGKTAFLRTSLPFILLSAAAPSSLNSFTTFISSSMVIEKGRGNVNRNGLL